jgi:hypothetical protein
MKKEHPYDIVEVADGSITRDVMRGTAIRKNLYIIKTVKYYKEEYK